MLKGKGIWINVIKQCDNGDMDVIRDKLLKMKADYVIVKAVNGYSGYNYVAGIDLVKVLHTYLDPVGIQVAVFAAPYGDAFGVGNWKKEVDRIVRRMNVDLPMIKYFILDIEGRWKHANNSAGIASLFMEELTSELRSDVILGFSSYRYPNMHPEIPYSAFLSRCEINMPQVYWEGSHNPGEQLRICVDQYQAIGYGPADMEFIPAAPAYHRPDLDPPWRVHVDDMRVFHEVVVNKKLPGETWWDYEHIRSTGLLPVIAEFVFEITDPVGPDPGEDPGIHIHEQYAYRQHDHVDTNKQLADLRKNTDERIKAQAGAINFLGETLILRIDNMNLKAINKVGELEARIRVMEMKISFWNWIRKIFGKVADEDPE